MSKTDISFEDFLFNIEPAHLGFVTQTHAFMLDKGCTFKIEAAKNGHVLSYIFCKTKKVIANYVFRKSGLIMRIYCDNIGNYPEILKALPDGMKRNIEKAPLCKRLHDPAKCNSRCPMGYIFELDGVKHKKCRYNSFMLAVTEAHYDAIREFLAGELNARHEKPDI